MISDQIAGSCKRSLILYFKYAQISSMFSGNCKKIQGELERLVLCTFPVFIR